MAKNNNGIVIDFSSTESAKQNIYRYLQNNISFISGTTGIDISSFHNSNYTNSFVYSQNMTIPIVDLFMTFNSLNSKDLEYMGFQITEFHQIGKNRYFWNSNKNVRDFKK